MFFDSDHDVPTPVPLDSADFIPYNATGNVKRMTAYGINVPKKRHVSPLTSAIRYLRMPVQIKDANRQAANVTMEKYSQTRDNAAYSVTMDTVNLKRMECLNAIATRLSAQQAITRMMKRVTPIATMGRVRGLEGSKVLLAVIQSESRLNAGVSKLISWCIYNCDFARDPTAQVWDSGLPSSPPLARNNAGLGSNAVIIDETNFALQKRLMNS